MKDKFVLFLILVAVVAMLPGCDFIYYSTPRDIDTALKWCEPHGGLKGFRVDGTGRMDSANAHRLIVMCNSGIELTGWVRQ